MILKKSVQIHMLWETKFIDNFWGAKVKNDFKKICANSYALGDQIYRFKLYHYKLTVE